jgi:hypothetical protein
MLCSPIQKEFEAAASGTVLATNRMDLAMQASAGHHQESNALSSLWITHG